MDIHPYSFDQLLDGTLIAQAAFALSYFISALVVSGNAYAGFNAVLLGLVYASFIALAYLKVKNDLSRTMYGIILGVAVMLTFVSLENAVFWGQYAGCESSSTTVYSVSPTYAPTNSPTSSRRLFDDVESRRRLNSIGVQCSNRSAMRSVCAFSVLMFLSYLFLIALLIRYKNDILKGAAAREQYAAVPSSAQPAVSSKIPSSYAAPGSAK